MGVRSVTLQTYLKLQKAGAARGTRTPDPVITNDVLYQLSYCGIKDLARQAPDLGAS